MKITRRKFNKIVQIIKGSRLNGDLVKFCLNLAKRVFVPMKAEKDIPYPTTIMLELTNRCNLRCTMCPRVHDYGRDMELGDMDIELAKQIIDECYPYLQSIGLTGMGETLFARNLLEVAKYVKSKKSTIVTSLSTNANIPDFIEKISAVLPYVDTVQVSIDGVGSVYDSIRVGGTFEPFDANVRKLADLASKNNVDIMFNMVVSKENYTSMPDVIEYASKVGVKYVNFNYINLACITNKPVEYYDVFRTNEYMEILKKARDKAAENRDIEVTGLADFDSNWVGKCKLLYNHFQINYDGNVPPCCAKPFSKEYNFGNVKGNSVMAVLNSDKAKAFRSQWSRVKCHKFCNKCHLSSSAKSQNREHDGTV